jgi:hypothetical protein
MKKTVSFLALVALVTTISCSDKPAEVKKEIIVVPAAPTIIVKDPPAKATTIIVDKNGVKVESKKVEVKVVKQ